MALPQTKKTGNRANVGPLFRFSGIGPGISNRFVLDRYIRLGFGSRQDNHGPLHTQIIMERANVRESPRMRKGYAEPRKAQGWIRGRLRYTESRLRRRDDEA